MIGRYRIYPAWFDDAGSAPMLELAQREACRLEFVDVGLAITASDQNHRGHYLDFEVLYVSCANKPEE